MRRVYLPFALSVFFLISSFNLPAHAVGGFLNGSAYDWNGLESGFSNLMYQVKRGVRLERELGKRTPLWAVFTFCPTTNGYKWAAIYNEQDRVQAIDMATAKLNAQPGRCTGSTQMVVRNQWDHENTTIPKLSQFVAQQRVSGMLSERQRKEKDAMSREIQALNERHKAIKTMQDQARWELDRDALKIRRDEMKQKHDAEQRAVSD